MSSTDVTKLPTAAKHVVDCHYIEGYKQGWADAVKYGEQLIEKEKHHD